MAAPEASALARPEPVRQGLVARAAQAVWERRHPEWATDESGEVRPRLRLPALGLPRYLADRAVVRAQGHDRPWITADAQVLLEQLLRPDDRVLEWGSGGTTSWFASQVAAVDSIETSREWHARVAERLAHEGRENARLHLVAHDDHPTPEAHREAYVGALPHLAPGSLDVVLVDAEHRDHCALRALDLLRPGGLLVLDNATTYLPATTRSPWRVDEPATALWASFVERTAGWRCAWTTNGVWDTAVWFKP